MMSSPLPRITHTMLHNPHCFTLPLLQLPHCSASPMLHLTQGWSSEEVVEQPPHCSTLPIAKPSPLLTPLHCFISAALPSPLPQAPHYINPSQPLPPPLPSLPPLSGRSFPKRKVPDGLRVCLRVCIITRLCGEPRRVRLCGAFAV